MALIGNHSLINRVINRQFAGGVSSGYSECYAEAGCLQNRTYGGFDSFAATPVGYTHPIAWVLPRKSGGLASFQQLTASGTVTNAPLARGINLIADALAASVSTTSAALALIVGLEAAITASGTVTSADLALALQLQASITASGTVTSADLGSILNLIASLSASGVLTNAGIVTLINLSADISSNTALSPETLATSLLDNSDIETGYSMRESLRLVLSSAAGKLSGAATTTVTIRNVTDDKNRIVATVDASGNRSAVAYDVSE